MSAHARPHNAVRAIALAVAAVGVAAWIRHQPITAMPDDVMPGPIRSDQRPHQAEFRPVKTDTPPEQDAQSLATVRAWAERDPQAAAAWAVALPESTEQTQALDQVVLAWANRDLDAAVQWAEARPKLPDKNRALAAIAGEALRTDPLEALAISLELPSDDATDELIRRAALELAAKDAGDAVELFAKINDDALRARVLGAVATVLSDSDPAAAATLLENAVPEGRVQADTTVAIAQRWAQSEPGQAAEWVDRLPSGAMKRAAIDNVAAIWARTDKTNARQWAASHQ